MSFKIVKYQFKCYTTNAAKATNISIFTNMNVAERKHHWENIFSIKDTSKVSWYQPVPEISLKIIGKLKLPKNAKIIDAGYGDSYLPDYLLKKGYSQITLADISEKALEEVKKD